MSGARRRPRGFTLLEVMVAMAILAAALTWIVVGMARNISAENHAKLITTATFLARSKMNDLEDDLYDKGFGEFEKELSGNFEDKGFQRFSWRVVVDKVELPSTDQVQSMLGKANDAQAAAAGKDSTSTTSTTSTTDPMTSSVGAMSSQFGLIKDVLEGGIRRLTVQVLWYEGQKTFDVSVVAFYTDPRRVDQAVQIAAAPPGTQPNGTSGTGTSGTGTPAGTPSTTTPGTTK
jgi:general secretion pathway protein I